METLLQDIRYGIRTLLKTPGFVSIAVLSLALGIGANTAIFSIVDALLLRQLPVEQPERLALVGDARARGIFGGIAGGPLNLVSEAELKELRKQKRVFTDACGMVSMALTYRATLAGSSSNEPLHARLVTGNYFSVLGVRPAAGRLFTDAVDAPISTHADVVISYSWWKRRFATDPNVIGQTLRIADRVYTIIGVAAPEFFGTTVGESPDAWFPFSMMSQLPPYWDFHDNLDHSFYVIGRLQPAVSLQQGSAALTLLIRQLLAAYVGSPSARDRQLIQRTSIQLTPAATGLSELRRGFSLSLRVLMGVVALVLLIACANVANLLLARATARQREMSIRMAIGSSRTRTVRQLLTESLLLSLAGGALGVLFAMWGSTLLVSLVSTGPDPVALNVNPNFRMLAFTVLVSLLTGVLFGVAPAFRASSVNVNSSLREGRSGTATRNRMFTSRLLVISQVALSLLLLIGAGLFIGSFRNLENIETGFNRNNLLLFSLDMSSTGFKQDSRLAPIYQNIENRVKQIPGVKAAAFSMFSFHQGAMTFNISAEGHPEVKADDKDISVNVTGPDYLVASGIPLVAGRYLNNRDTAQSPRVAVIDETAAHEIFGNELPLGRHISFDGMDVPADRAPMEIVGIVKNSKHQSLREKPYWSMYIPYTQRNQFIDNLMVRVDNNASAVTTQVRNVIHELQPNLPITEVATMGEQVDRSINTQLLIARLSGFFGLLALLLAAIGLYGILSYSVVQRTSEIGVRMALGAQSVGVLWMILRETFVLVALGIVIGIPAALLSSRWIESLLYGTKANDVVTMLAAIGILAAIGCIAGLLPARRASHVDPMVALRYE